MNEKNDYDVHIRDYCRMTLYLVEKELNIKILLQILQQDSGELLGLLLSIDKIREWSIMNAKVDIEENDDINHRARDVIKLT